MKKLIFLLPLLLIGCGEIENVSQKQFVNIVEYPDKNVTCFAYDNQNYGVGISCLKN